MPEKDKIDPHAIRIGTWNIKWAKPDSPRGKIISDKLAATNCDIVCVTEGFAGILPNGGHVIDAGKDWGYPIPKGPEGRRKVLLWSKHPWTPHARARGSAELPGGRFVAGSTETPSGDCLTVVGVCIPWFNAGVLDGGKNRVRWQDHAAWLWGFGKLRCHFPMSRTVVLGDFNQKIPKKGTFVPQYIHDALMHGFEGFQFATEGKLEDAPKPSIDHIAHSPDLVRKGIGIWPKKADDGKCLSDHFGVWCDFRLD